MTYNYADGSVTELSDVVEHRDCGDGAWMWVVLWPNSKRRPACESGYFGCREDAYECAREAWPELTDDE